MNRPPAKRKNAPPAEKPTPKYLAEIQAVDRRVFMGLRTFGTVTVVGFVCWSAVTIVQIVADATVKVLAVDTPWYMPLITAVAGLLAGGTATTVLPGWGIWLRFRNIVGGLSSRITELEVSVDPNRTSSDLREDGTHELD